jgi:regulation of enolase protein 1 (concanavalin A-like superfamily)
VSRIAAEAAGRPDSGTSGVTRVARRLQARGGRGRASLPLGLLLLGLLAVPVDRGRAQDEGGPVTPNTVRVQPTDGDGQGHWITLPGYDELGSPAFSRDGQWVAFDAYKRGYNQSPAECWIARRDGTQLTKLAVGATPRWSPDGKRLLFMRETDTLPPEQRGIFVIDRDGTGERRIGEGRWPDWSPDGQAIAFSLGGRRGPWGGPRIMARVWTARADGTHRREIADGDCPSFSPDGRMIACCQQDPALPAPVIRVVDLGTERQTIIGYGWFRANWSADGRRLVANGFTSPETTGMVTLSAEGPRRGAQNLLPEFERATSPCYSSDGKALVFIAKRAQPQRGAGAGAEAARTIAGWGTVTDRAGDCTVREEGGKLTVTVPEGTHDLNPNLGGMKAPRVLKEVEGDFTAQVKITGDFRPGEEAASPIARPFNGAGLLLWQDEKNFIRLERNAYWVEGRYVCYPPLFEQYEGGEYQETNPDPTLAEEFFRGRSTWLRLGRRGDRVIASYSHDGQEWTEAKEVGVKLPAKARVGVAVVNTSARPLSVEFEDFRLSTK